MSDTRIPRVIAIASAAVIAALSAHLAVADNGENPFMTMTPASAVVMLAQGRCGMDRMDLDGDGKVTKEEFRQGHDAVFSSTDSNGDGVLDADERNAHREMMRQRKGRCGAGKCGNSKGGE
ncbi:MAG: hypothetical protein ABF290_17255 [Thiogranum sp.]